MVYQSISIMEDGSDPFIIHERYKIIRHIGSGSSGTVCSVYDQQTQSFCAIKKINNIFNKSTITKRCLREIKCLHHFHDHPRIIELLDVNLVNNDLYLVFQCMDTSLHDVIHSPQPLYDIHYQWILYQLFSGLQYIHSANIIHRDLTPANILINKDCQIKIGDFGMARGYPVNNNNNSIYLNEYVCTRWYRAPEIILNTGYYDQQIDIWSLGCIFGEILGRKVLFQGKDHVDQLQVIMTQYGLPNDLSFLSSTTIPSSSSHQSSYTNELLNMIYQQQHHPYPSINFHVLFPNCPMHGIDLLNQLLQLDPEKRIHMGKALQHPFVNIFSDPEEESLHCPPLDLSITTVNSDTLDSNKNKINNNSNSNNNNNNRFIPHDLILDEIHSFKQSFPHHHFNHQQQNENSSFYHHHQYHHKELTTLTNTSTPTSKLLLNDQQFMNPLDHQHINPLNHPLNYQSMNPLNHSDHYYNDSFSLSSSLMTTTTTTNHQNEHEDLMKSSVSASASTSLTKNKSTCTECTESDMEDPFVLHHRIRNDELLQFMENDQWFMKWVDHHHHQEPLEFTLGRT